MGDLNLAINLNLASGLHILKLEYEITSAITNNQVVILSGETGSGKSTQLPKICAKIRDNINQNMHP
jgi:ATP-dependent helicase HrpA